LLPTGDQGIKTQVTYILHQISRKFKKCLPLCGTSGKARNDHRFNNKTWSVNQVHYATKGEMAALLSYGREEIDSKQAMEPHCF
jgi:hypothetical protein